MSSPTPKHTNRLIHSTSPYLLQHAHNPVDWYPWGPEALETARKLNKPLFLSVGYSTCYWCHVMERQSFENEAIAAVMNEHFVNIKVDREERPDVDQLYMTAVQILTRQGGWPMSVFLTPDLKPFFGGTYFPPEDMVNRPGFPRVCKSIANTFATKRDQVDRSADEIVRILQRVAQPRGPQQPLTVDTAWIESLITRSIADYDNCYGGFSDAPKFPRQTLLELLLAYLQSPDTTEDAAEIQKQLLHTLDQMAEGGIRDQLGGGFHRYSTDEKWLVPHFEIMLYDNAMLATCYTRAWQITKTERYARYARGILDFILREMTGPAGEFHTAFDAEVDAQEGLSYLWTPDEVREVLQEGSGFRVQGSVENTGRTPDSPPSSLNPEPRTLNPSSEPRTPNPDLDLDLFLRSYGLLDGPNFADPHHSNGVPDKYILFWPVPPSAVAEKLNTTEQALDARLAPMRQALHAARLQRKQPLLDTKILTSWNALTIRALALAGHALDEPRYLQAATRAATYLLTHHRQPDGALIRTTRPDTQPTNDQFPMTNSPIPGFLDDYAFLAQALLALHTATGDQSWRDHAAALTQTMKEKFLDPTHGGFYTTPIDSTDLIVRQKTAQDSPLPSGNAVAAIALTDLGDLDEARRTLATFAQSLEDNAEGMSSMAQAALHYLAHAAPFTITPTGHTQDEQRPPTPDHLAQSALTLSAQWASPTELHITINIHQPYHLNANPAPPGLTPTTLALPNTNATITYPPGQDRQFPFAPTPLRVYDGQVVLRARLPEPPPPNTTLRATLTYQPCTEDACLPATTKSIQLPPTSSP